MRIALPFAALLLLAPSSAHADGRTLVFDVLRKNSKVGEHRISFTQQDGLLTVDISIDIRSKILFFPFRYQHSNREVWRGRELVSLDSKTQINDRKEALQVRESGRGYDVSFNGKPSRVEGPIFTTSYWLQDVITQTRLLNSQKGNLLAIFATGARPVTSPSVQGGIPAFETRMADRKNFNVNVAYDAKGCLVGMSFKPPVDSTPITYRLVSRPEAARAPDLLENPLLVPCLATEPQTARQ